MLISTYSDADHIGVLDEVLDSFKVKSVYAPKIKHTTQAYKDFLLAIKREKMTIKTTKVGVSLPTKGAKTTMLRTDKNGTTVFDGNESSYTFKQSK